MAGKILATILLLLCAGPEALAQTVRIGVLGLFHPREITLRATNGEALVVRVGAKIIVLEPGAPTGIAHIQVAEDGLLLEFRGQLIRANELHVEGRSSNATRFLLGIPGGPTRKYQGTLEVKAVGGTIVAIVTMNLESAVAAVVAAETAPDTPQEALQAQAVVARSYLVTGKGRHRDYDFCDLTHCQLLRDAPGLENPATAAALATRGMVIVFQEKPIAAMFTRSCGGHTRTPAELGVPIKDYPYYSVVCDVCYKSPTRWTRTITEKNAAPLLEKSESGRLAVNRLLGWSTVPSNNFTMRKDDGNVILEGAGEGHGIGLCQRGARAMAANGASFRQIISHYFPNTTLSGLEPAAF